jgi:glycerol-3-phosphate dehydrogenase (NAD(P)+)
MADIAVIGAGSWGTALAVLLSEKGEDVCLWGRKKEKTDAIDERRENTRYLPGVVFPPRLAVTNDLQAALAKVRYVVLAVPSHETRNAARLVSELLPPGTVVINTSKGIETRTLKRMSEVIREEITGKTSRVAVLSGPSHAEEVGRGIPTAVVVASADRQTAEEVQDLFMTPRFRVYTNPDMVGVELGAALKNVIALGTGIAEGMGYGDNAKAALITRGLAEIARLGVKAGAQPLTFAGLTGIGDLVVTCTSMHSRNRRAGILLGQGYSMEEAVQEVGMVVEGIRATEAACALAARYQVTMPISEQLYQVLFKHKDPQGAVRNLMLRQRRHEMEEVVLGDDKW